MGKMRQDQLEAKISEALIKFEKEFMDRGPMEADTFIVRDAVMLRLKGVLTPRPKSN
jgi:uncharacterized protein YbcI